MSSEIEQQYVGPKDEGCQYCYCVYHKRNSILVSVANTLISNDVYYYPESNLRDQVTKIPAGETCPVCPDTLQVPAAGSPAPQVPERDRTRDEALREIEEINRQREILRGS